MMTKTGREDPIAVRTRFGSGIDGHRGIGQYTEVDHHQYLRDLSGVDVPTLDECDEAEASIRAFAVVAGLVVVAGVGLVVAVGFLAALVGRWIVTGSLAW